MKRAAIYIRVSTMEQAEKGLSLEDQRQKLKAYCQAHDYEIAGIYEDAGISAKDITHRPEMQHMLEDVTMGAADVVLIWSLSRFARNLKDFVVECDRLDKMGIALVSLTECFDSSTSVGRMIRGILAVFAQYERDLTSERVRNIAITKAMRGDRTCGPILGYDLIKKGHMTINKKEAEVVRFIFAEYLRSKCLVTVAEKCAARGYRGKKGAVLKPWHIQRILVNFTYCGFYPFYRMPMLASYGNFPPLIELRDFNKVQNLLIKQGKALGKGLERRTYKVPGGGQLTALVWRQARAE